MGSSYRLLDLGLVLGVSAGCGGTGAAQEAPVGSGPGSSCMVGEPVSQHIALPATAGLYVEPTAFVEDLNGDILLAGSPIYSFVFDSLNQPEVAPDPEIFGVVIRKDGSIHPVPKPLDAPLGDPRALSLPDGGWEIVFAIDSTSEVGAYDHIGARYGRFDGRRWSDLELPLAAAVSTRYRLSSELARNRSGLWWALDAPPGSVRGGQRILLRNSRGWEERTLETGTSVSYLEIASPPDSIGLDALVVRPDTTRSSDGNSVFLYRLGVGGWNEVSQLANGAEGRAHTPVFVFQGDTPVMGWTATVRGGGPGGIEVRTPVRPTVGPPSHTVVDDASSMVRLALFGTHQIWVVDHPLAGGAGELRLVQVESGKVEILKALPNPFTGPFNVLASQTGELLVVGPLLDQEAGMLSSLVLRLPMNCGAAS